MSDSPTVIEFANTVNYNNGTLEYDNMKDASVGSGARTARFTLPPTLTDQHPTLLQLWSCGYDGYMLSGPQYGKSAIYCSEHHTHTCKCVRRGVMRGEDAIWHARHLPHQENPAQYLPPRLPMPLKGIVMVPMVWEMEVPSWLRWACYSWINNGKYAATQANAIISSATADMLSGFGVKKSNKAPITPNLTPKDVRFRLPFMVRVDVTCDGENPLVGHAVLNFGQHNIPITQDNPIMTPTFHVSGFSAEIGIVPAFAGRLHLYEKIKAWVDMSWESKHTCKDCGLFVKDPDKFNVFPTIQTIHGGGNVTPERAFVEKLHLAAGALSGQASLPLCWQCSSIKAGIGREDHGPKSISGKAMNDADLWT